ncbi:glucose 1-dehydrogenase [Amycolatopsis sp. NPDC005232]|uniref:SDR family NAD(P)-dependent oxidoreductase n=1 Tax=Amycolatopsis sp. NPDC005232 TaxID=3157027 RepID=UPI0033A9C98E
MGRLSGKIAIITGAARGQGAEHARRFVDEGAKVVVGDVLTDEVEKVAADLGKSAVPVRHDVTDPDSWQAVLEATLSAFGSPTVLVNNAGVLGTGRLAAIDPVEFRRTLDINLLGPWIGLSVVGGHMAENGGGSIVNIASIAGHRATPGRGSYTASKWGLRGLTKSAAIEMGRNGVRVNAILPGYIDTPMLGRRRDQMVSETQAWAGMALPRMGQSSDISTMAVFLASDESGYCTGADFVVDGGASLGYFTPALRPDA